MTKEYAKKLAHFLEQENLNIAPGHSFTEPAAIRQSINALIEHGDYTPEDLRIAIAYEESLIIPWDLFQNFPEK